MKDWAAIQTYKSGIFPNVLAVDSTGATTTDGTEYIAQQINNGIFGWTQDFMDYANLTPDGVIEATGSSQLREAIQKGNAVGPGMYVQRAINDDPATHGDRVLILSEQGVLVATYPGLDAACYVGDANNTTVANAGGKFYRSSDAAGTTPNTAGPYLQLPAQPDPKFLKQYLGDGTDFTISGSGWATTRAIAIPYKTTDGAWRIIFNTAGDHNSAFNHTFTMSGVTFKTGATQALYGASTIPSDRQVFTSGGNGVISANYVVSTNNSYIAGDVELDSMPTWADDFDIEWGITY